MIVHEENIPTNVMPYVIVMKSPDIYFDDL